MAKKKPKKEPFKLYHLSDAENGKTLAAALRSLDAQWTWGVVRKAVTGRRVQVNGNLCLDIARRVTKKDVIKLWDEPLAKPVSSNHIRFAYVDPHLLVVEKPAGVTSVRHFEERRLSAKRKQLQPTLEELLPKALDEYLLKQGGFVQKELPKRSTTKLRSNRPIQAPKPSALNQPSRHRIYPVHRLDRDTSGLMLFARTPQAVQSLGKMFRKHAIDRRYHAVVHGHIEAQTIRSFLVRDRGDGKRGSVQGEPDESAQEAITHIRPIEFLDGYTIVECSLETGRTHQIRIHLSEAGHMLCGENIYTREVKGRTMRDESGAPRQALHSTSLQFKHPISGEPIVLAMKWPADLAKWLTNLRNARRLESDEP